MSYIIPGDKLGSPELLRRRIKPVGKVVELPNPYKFYQVMFGPQVIERNKPIAYQTSGAITYLANAIRTTATTTLYFQQPKFQLSSTNCSFLLNCKISAWGTWAALISMSNAANDNSRIAIQRYSSNAQTRVYVNNIAYTITTYDPAILVDNKYHVFVLTFDNGNIEFWKDGNKEWSITHTETSMASASTDELILGDRTQSLNTVADHKFLIVDTNNTWSDGFISMISQDPYKYFKSDVGNLDISISEGPGPSSVPVFTNNILRINNQ